MKPNSTYWNRAKHAEAMNKAAHYRQIGQLGGRMNMTPEKAKYFAMARLWLMTAKAMRSGSQHIHVN